VVQDGSATPPLMSPELEERYPSIGSGGTK